MIQTSLTQKKTCKKLLKPQAKKGKVDKEEKSRFEEKNYYSDLENDDDSGSGEYENGSGEYEMKYPYICTLEKKTKD